MAKPDLDDGWLKYAHELDAALAVADFTKGARIVLREVFAQVFGPAKARSAILVPGVIAENSGMARPHVSRAIRELTDAKVIERQSDGAFRFIKDYESWLLKGEPRLSCREAAYCRFATAIALAYAHGYPLKIDPSERTSVGTDECQSGTYPGTAPVPIEVQNGTYPGTETVPIQVPRESPPPDPPNRNGRAEFENGELRIDGAVGVGPSCSGPRTLDELVARVGEEFKPKVAAYVRANGPDIVANLGERLDCYLAALRKASKLRKEPDNPHSWCIVVAQRLRDEGLPPEPVSLRNAPVVPSVVPPGRAESLGCEHCSGEGQVTVYHPDPATARQPATTSADCTCLRGRAIRQSRKADDARRIPDLVDVLAGRSIWMAEEPGAMPPGDRA